MSHLVVDKKRKLRMMRVGKAEDVVENYQSLVSLCVYVRVCMCVHVCVCAYVCVCFWCLCKL